MTDTQPSCSMNPPGEGLLPVYVKKIRGAGFWIAVGLASFFFLCTIFFCILFIGSLLLSKAITTAATEGAQHVSETIVEGKGENKVAIISIKGILSTESAEGLLFERPGIVEVVKQQLEQAAKDTHVKATLLDIDSPGGGITASDIIYNQIMKFKKDTKKKVVVYMNDIAASGGYYISTAADAIVAHPTTITGSIGVIMPLINVSDLISRYGIKDNSITSGDMKEIGSPLKPMTSEESAILKEIIDELYMQFVSIVSSGRNLDIETVKKLADGRIYTGKQALEKGLVDQLGYREDAINLAKKLAGLNEATVIQYKERYGVAELFGLMSGRFFQTKTIKLDISQLQEQVKSKPSYLWTGYTGDK